MNTTSRNVKMIAMVGRPRLIVKTTHLLIALVVMSSVMCFSCCAGIFDNTLHVFKYGPATYSAGEIDVDGDVVCLKTKRWPVWPDSRPWPVSSSLYVLLDESAYQAIDKYMALRAKVPDAFSPSADQQLKTIADATGIEAILITNFDRIIQGPSIYDKHFRKYLSPETKKLLKQKPQGDALARLNWLLLRDAGFAGYIEAIEADGDITGVFKPKEQIFHIQIYPKKMSASELNDFCVIFSPTNRIALADITQDKIKPYTVDHCSFQFEGNILVKVEAEAYGFGYPAFVKGNSVSLGSLKNTGSLVLPCSIGDFEKVFGTADEIDRMVMW